MTGKYWVDLNGEILGPMSLADVKDMLRFGNISPNNLVWEESSSKKFTVAEILTTEGTATVDDFSLPNGKSADSPIEAKQIKTFQPMESKRSEEPVFEPVPESLHFPASNRHELEDDGIIEEVRPKDRSHLTVAGKGRWSSRRTRILAVLVLITAGLIAAKSIMTLLPGSRVLADIHDLKNDYPSGVDASRIIRELGRPDARVFPKEEFLSRGSFMKGDQMWFYQAIDSVDDKRMVAIFAVSNGRLVKLEFNFHSNWSSDREDVIVGAWKFYCDEHARNAKFRALRAETERTFAELQAKLNGEAFDGSSLDSTIEQSKKREKKWRSYWRDYKIQMEKQVILY